MIKICVVTATRAEYGLLKRLMGLIDKDENLELKLCVTGTHLSSDYGMTIDEITGDGFQIDRKISILAEGNGTKSTAYTMANAAKAFADYFDQDRPDMVVVLGDRYELLPIVSDALVYCIPVAHISGGEVTEGAIDDCIRHSITKMSYLHFVSCEEYRRRIIQLGEDPKRVFNVGDVGVENIKHTELIGREELAENIKFDLSKPYFAVTFHPVTTDLKNAENQVNELLQALDVYSDRFGFVITGSNADAEGMKINRILNDYAIERDNVSYYKSLGIKRYLSLLKNSMGVIGNSSSGIVEAPSLGIPTVNIGNRQKGRLLADSIVNCSSEKKEIVESIDTIISDDFRRRMDRIRCPYDGNNSSELILMQIKKAFSDGIDLPKRFRDISFEE